MSVAPAAPAVFDDRTQDKLMQEAFRLQDQADRLGAQLALERSVLAQRRVVVLSRQHRVQMALAGGRVMAAAMHEHAALEARAAVADQLFTVQELESLVRDMSRGARVRFEAADALFLRDDNER